MFDWAKIPTLLDHLKGRYFFVVALVLLVVLITPDALSVRLGFDAWLDDYRAWVGVILIGASLVWLLKFAAWIGDRVNTRRIAFQRREALERDMTSLSGQELFLLLFALARNSRTVYMQFGDGVALSLCNKGLFKTATGAGDHMYWPYLIPGHVWDYLIGQQMQLLLKARSDDSSLDLRFDWFEQAIAKRSTLVRWTKKCGF